MTRGEENSERVLVLMPTAKDGERTANGLGQANISCFVCGSFAELCREIEHGAGAAIITEETVMADHEGRLACIAQAEPSWSSFPLIILTRESHKSLALPESLSIKATLVERPVRFVTLKSVVDTAIRHRRRQYQLRSVLQELERANKELELRVNQRTAKLQETITELEAFSYSVSHDLRSPLRAMQGYAEALLEEETLSEQGKEYLTRIRKASGRLDLLIQDVLAYSKVAKGEVQLQPVQLAMLVDDILRSYPEFSECASIEVKQPLPPVVGHEGYLTQSITNILNNAIKFVPAGVRPQVRVWADVTGDWVRLNLADNGIGIEPKHREQIFQLFGRVHPDKVYNGSGIGLAIVKKALERMGGSVGVESRIPDGSCFFLILPLAR